MSGAEFSGEALLRITGLGVDTPGGDTLLRDVSLSLKPGETVVLLGGSGAGKSTLVTALHDPSALEGLGFAVRADSRELACPVGIVPQRGALFDHLSVAGNLALAMRNAAAPLPGGAAAVEEALDSVDLPTAWASGGRAVTGLSGGEAQRLAVARTLAGGRKILFLDEPSAGLDPLRVDALADLLRSEIRVAGATALVITHELEFAAGFADRFLYLDRNAAALVELEVAMPAPDEPRSVEDRRRIAGDVGDQLLERMKGEAQAGSDRGDASVVERIGRRLREGTESFAIVPRLLAALPTAIARPRDFFEVFTVVLKQALVRPAAFFGVVSVLVGFTLLYILHRSLGGGEIPLRPDKLFRLIGSMHIIALAPALSGILFASTSSNALTAWLGGMSLTRQTTALRGLGIGEARYLWLPAWIGLVLSYSLLSLLFVLGMVGGGMLYLELSVPELGHGWEVITADLVEPLPERVVFRTRAVALMVIYAVGIAADGVAKGSLEKHRAEDVTIAMVRSVMASTLWIVALELGSLLYIYAGLG